MYAGILFLVILLIAPGCINYGLLLGQKAFVRYVSVSLFVILPFLILVYIYLHQQKIDALAARDLLGWSDYDQEDMDGFILTVLSAPVFISGVISSLLAATVTYLKTRRAR